MRLSKHFTLAEMVATSVHGVDNTPSVEEMGNMTFLCAKVLEPLREQFGPLHTTSGYRSPEVNRIVGGAPSSMHVHGCAWDGVPRRSAVLWRDVVMFLAHCDLPVDQVIYEFGHWIHVGIRPGGEGFRQEALMIFEPGKYEPWDPKDPRVLR